MTVKYCWNNGATKYFSNFCRTFQMLLISCENNLILTWSVYCFIFDAATNQTIIFGITDINLSVQNVPKLYKIKTM